MLRASLTYCYSVAVMKKPAFGRILSIAFAIVLCSLLAAPLILKPPPAASLDEQQATSQTTPIPALKSDPEEPSQTTSENTSQPKQPTPTASPQPTNQKTDNKLEVAINNAISYIDQTQEPYALLMLNVLYRQFGIPEFNDTLQSYDEILSSSSQPLLRLLRRIADHNNTVDDADFNAVVNEVEDLTVPALYADQRSPPDDYEFALMNAKNSGGYMMTHALLATIWLQENNGNTPLPENFIETLYYDTAALTENGLPVTDLALEAAAFLHEAGQGDLVNPEFAENVIATQNPDGGWSLLSGTPSGSNWHPSVLALMFLLHVAYPAESYPPMLAPAAS
jgi:hypothetical protein